jgi:hypothetical protein
MRERIVPKPGNPDLYRVFWCWTDSKKCEMEGSHGNRQPSMKCSEQDCEHIEWEEENIPNG